MMNATAGFLSLSTVALAATSDVKVPSGTATLGNTGAPTNGATTNGASETSTRPGVLDTVSKYLGATYFTFFDGPGVGEGFGFSPNLLGRAHDAGWTTWTNLSARLKVTENLAIDYQFRLQQVVTNQFEFRSQGGRLGISGTLLKGENWSLTGALNSDIPGVGQITQARTILLNPGLFSSFNYKPKGSRWSVFALVAPRVWFYSDRLAMEEQALKGGAVPGQKPDFIFSIQPSINYAISERSGLRSGITIDIRKNANSPDVVRWFAPVDVGYTYSLNKYFNIYPHLRVSTPLDNGLRRDLNRVVPWTHTASLGIWLNGTIL